VHQVGVPDFLGQRAAHRAFLSGPFPSVVAVSPFRLRLAFRDGSIKT
jgi:hypothetical protein